MYTGSRKPLSIQVFNDSDKAIKEFKVKLHQQTKFIAQLHSTNDPGCRINFGGYGMGFGWNRYRGLEKRYSKKMVMNTHIKGVGLPIPPGGSWQGDVLLDIPQGVEPSLPKQISPIIHQKYYLSVAAVTEGNIFTKKEAKAYVPVLVGSLHPSLRGFLPPTESQGQPYVIRVVENMNPQQFNQYLGPPMIQQQGIDPKSGSFSGNITGMDNNFFQNAQQPQQYLDEEDEGDNWARQQMQQTNNQ